MLVVQSANLALRFVLELAALAAFAYWGFQTGAGTILNWALGLGAPLLAAVFWGTFEAPRAAVKLSAPLHLLLALAFFALAVAGLYTAGQPNLARAFGLVFVVNQVLLLVWRQ